MSPKKYIVKLTPEERHEFEAIVARGKIAGWKLKRAQVLLKCDESDAGPAWLDEYIAEAFDTSVRSVENWRKQAVLQGPHSLLTRKARETPPVPRKLNGEQEAKLIALCCSEAPDGASRWSLRLLANTLVELKIVDSISHEAVRQVLKKHAPTLEKTNVVHSP